MSDKIIVIGSGISGVTTALTLQLLGYKTEIITEKVPTDIANKNAHPEFASLYPSASVIPHSVYSDQLESIFKTSQAFFYELRKLTFPGLVMHKHFEVFEEDPGDPKYRHWMMNPRPIYDLEPETIPKRKHSSNLHGWVFDCIFTDWPLYFPALIQVYKESGGQIIQQKVEESDLDELPADIIINCSGTGSPELFDDPIEEQLIMQGHLLHKPNADLITNNQNEIISYNYTPQASLYADQQGEACDVYCYPRKDGWVLGGSRQAGQLSQQKWSQKSDTDHYEINNITFPKPIIDLNNEILNHTFGLSLEYSKELTPSVGYRYIRSTNNGLRLDQETISGKTVYHNYGHGGAGVTLSWGAALQIAQQLTGGQTTEIQEQLLQKIKESDLEHLI
ncbi:FAD-dependent oxidoreductase [Fodinibius sp. Rm-B-1B1-1]|uniref:FAD-dependent oxidoreductase n=1 Tax=Fodinibius alkaliphilus TaxID=3140241 RepID=UPI00315A3E28